MDRYTKAVLTTIALALVWIAIGLASPSVAAQDSKYQIAATPHENLVWRLNTRTGDIRRCLLIAGEITPSASGRGLPNMSLPKTVC